MRERELFIRPVCAAVLLGAFCGPAFAGAAQQTKSLPRPPGVRVETLPRKENDKPQETSLAVNPRDPQNVIVSFHQAIGEGSDHYPGNTVDAHVAWSADGGKTWAIAPDTKHVRHTRALDAAVAFDLHGHAFMVYIGMDEIHYTTRHGEFLRRSLDGGRTWSAPVTLIERPGGQEPVMEHFPNIVADNNAGSPHAGTVYVMWDRILESGKRADIILTRSTDDGKTWSEPKAISHLSTTVGHTAAVGPDGTVYMALALTKGEAIVVTSSRDGGQTFGPQYPVVRAESRVRTSQEPWAAAEFPRACGLPNIGVDPRGRVYVVWGDFRNGDSDILAVGSDDRGRTWSKPVRVNDDPKSNGKDQVMHWATVDPVDGALYVAFYDRRADSKNQQPTITLARSTDGGRTFVNYAWSVKPTDPKQASIGDYIGLGAMNGRVYGSWAEHVPLPKGTVRNIPPPSGSYNEHEWPSGPSAMRVGIADFRTAVGAERRGAQ